MLVQSLRWTSGKFDMGNLGNWGDLGNMGDWGDSGRALERIPFSRSGLGIPPKQENVMKKSKATTVPATSTTGSTSETELGDIRKASLAAEPQYQRVNFQEIFFECLSEELGKAFRELVR